MHVSCTQALALAMGLMIATPVDAAAIGRPGEPNSAGSTDFNEPTSHGLHSVNKRSPIINPLAFLAALISDKTVGKKIKKIPGAPKLYNLFWFKKALISIGK